MRNEISEGQRDSEVVSEVIVGPLVLDGYLRVEAGSRLEVSRLQVWGSTDPLLEHPLCMGHSRSERRPRVEMRVPALVLQVGSLSALSVQHPCRFVGPRRSIRWLRVPLRPPGEEAMTVPQASSEEQHMTG